MSVLPIEEKDIENTEIVCRYCLDSSENGKINPCNCKNFVHKERSYNYRVTDTQLLMWCEVNIFYITHQSPRGVQKRRPEKKHFFSLVCRYHPFE